MSDAVFRLLGGSAGATGGHAWEQMMEVQALAAQQQQQLATGLGHVTSNAAGAGLMVFLKPVMNLEDRSGVFRVPLIKAVVMKTALAPATSARARTATAAPVTSANALTASAAPATTAPLEQSSAAPAASSATAAPAAAPREVKVILFESSLEYINLSVIANAVDEGDLRRRLQQRFDAARLARACDDIAYQVLDMLSRQRECFKPNSHMNMARARLVELLAAADTEIAQFKERFKGKQYPVETPDAEILKEMGDVPHIAIHRLTRLRQALAEMMWLAFWLAQRNVVPPDQDDTDPAAELVDDLNFSMLLLQDAWDNAVATGPKGRWGVASASGIKFQSVQRPSTQTFTSFTLRPSTTTSKSTAAPAAAAAAAATSSSKFKKEQPADDSAFDDDAPVKFGGSRRGSGGKGRSSSAQSQSQQQPQKQQREAVRRPREEEQERPFMVQGHKLYGDVAAAAKSNLQLARECFTKDVKYLKGQRDFERALRKGSPGQKNQ